MRPKYFKHGVAVLMWLAAGLPRAAFGQSPTSAQEPPQPSTVLVTAALPVKRPMADVEARIRTIVFRQAAAFERLSGFCRKGPITNLDLKVMCGRSEIQSKDKSLGEGLEAFEQHDYMTAVARFEAAYAKAGYPDAALMLAHMHRHGLGTPQDAAQGIGWLRAVAEDRFDPFRDRLRFNPNKPEATNARIDAAMALARIYQLGDGVEPDRAKAERWYARAAEFGFVPARPVDGSKVQATYEEAAGQSNGEARTANAASGADAGQRAPRASLGAPEQAKPAIAALPDTPSAGADDTVDLANDALDLALYRLATNAADAEALSMVRRAADESNTAGSLNTGSGSQAGEALFVVRVTGLRALPWKSYGAMRAAVSAYEKNKSLAPDAVFRFAVMPPAGMELPPNFALRVRTKNGQEFPIRIEHGELFSLPLLPDLRGDAELVSNFRAGALRIGLLVHTRAVSPEKLRLGDLRLRNEINAAIAMFDNRWEFDAKCRGTSRWIRCKRPSKAVWHRPWTATSGGWVVEGSRRAPLKMHHDPDKHMYRMPVASEQWGNDAIIEFEYKVPMQRPRELFEAAVYEADDEA